MRPTCWSRASKISLGSHCFFLLLLLPPKARRRPFSLLSWRASWRRRLSKSSAKKSSSAVKTSSSGGTPAGRASGARRGDFELLSRVLSTLGSAISAGALTTQLLKWNEFARGLARFHQRYDMLLTPTLAHPPVRHGQGDPGASMNDSGAVRPLEKETG